MVDAWECRRVDLYLRSEQGVEPVIPEAPLPAVVRDHEPHRALHGGPDGLDFYRYLCSQGLQFLSPGGILALEIGAGQGEAVTALCRDAGLHDVALSQDYAGLDRIVIAMK